LNSRKLEIVVAEKQAKGMQAIYGPYIACMPLWALYIG